jgi:hypothetical protein
MSRQSAQRLPGWTTDIARNPVQSTEEEEEVLLKLFMNFSSYQNVKKFF